MSCTSQLMLSFKSTRRICIVTRLLVKPGIVAWLNADSPESYILAVMKNIYPFTWTASPAFGNSHMEGTCSHWRSTWAEYPRLPTALHWNGYFSSSSLCCSLRGVLKTNGSWRAWGPGVGWPSEEGVARREWHFTLAAWSPAPFAQAHFLVLISHACGQGPRELRMTAWGKAEMHITGWLCVTGFRIHFLWPLSCFPVCFFLFSDLPCSLILVCHCWILWASACLEIWNFHSFGICLCCAFWVSLPSLWNTVRRYVLCLWNILTRWVALVQIGIGL